MDESIIPSGEDMAYSKDISRSILGSESPLLLNFGNFFSFFLAFSGFLFIVLDSGLGCFGSRLNFLDFFDFSHNIKNLIFYKQSIFYNQQNCKICISLDIHINIPIAPPVCYPLVNNLILMISTRKTALALLQTVKFSKVSWTTGNPYNVRWQYKWKPAYYTYLKDGFEPTKVGKPEDSPAVRPPFYTYFQDFLYRVFPALKTIHFRSERYQDPFQIFVLPSTSLFFYQFWDLALGFKGLTILPWMLFWTRIRDRTLDPEINQVHLRDIIHQNAEIAPLFKPQSIHLLDYDFEYDNGFPCDKKFPQFKNGFFRFFNNDTHMATGIFKFGDLQSGATMTLHVKTMPVHGQFRYQVGQPFYFYDIRAEVVHNGQFKEIVIVDQNVELKKKRPFLIII